MHELDLDFCTIDFLENDVAHTHFKGERIISADQVQEMFDALEKERGGRKVLLMVSVGDGTTMSNEARAYASSEDSCKYIAADAILVRDFGHQLAANVFVRHHKPHRPIQMFNDKSKAMDWLAMQRNLIGA